MDFQIIQYLGQTQIKCSMEQQAIAHWFNQEIAHDLPLLEKILHKIEQLQLGQIHGEQLIMGKEYSLYIDKEQVVCQANNLIDDQGQEQTELEPNFYYYESEARACCGLEDFVKLLQSYLEFHQS